MQNICWVSLALFLPAKVFFLFPLVLLIFSDEYLYRKEGIRLERSFLFYVQSLPSFFSSAPLIPWIVLGSIGAALALSFVPPLPVLTIVSGMSFFRKINYDTSSLFLLWLRRAPSARQSSSSPFSQKMGRRIVDCHLPPRMNVVLVFLESFRAQRTNIPCFEKMANEGIFFPNFYANSPKSSRALLSTLCSVPSDVHPIDRKTSAESLADVLKKRGYHTAYYQNGSLLFDNQGDFVATHGFDHIMGHKDILKAFPQAETTSWGVHDEYLYRFIRKDLPQPYFLTLFTMSNHHPWKSPSGWKSGLSHPYLQTTEYADKCFGDFVKTLDDNTLLVALGDHGQPLGEHGSYVPVKNIYEENVRVPCFLWAKKGIPAQRIETVGSQIDVLPTILDLLQIPVPQSALGSSLLREREQKVYFHTPFALYSFGVREGKMKYIENMLGGELYDLAVDPEEKHPLPANDMWRSLIRDYKGFVDGLYSAPHPTKKEGDFANALVQDGALIEYVRNTPTLARLDLSYCHLLSNRGIQQSLEHLADLEELSLRGIEHVSEEAFRGISLPFLASLNVEGCALLTDEALVSITCGCPRLTRVHLSAGSHDGLTEFARRSPHLRWVSLEGTFDERSADPFIAYCKDLTHLFINENPVVKIDC